MLIRHQFFTPTEHDLSSSRECIHIYIYTDDCQILPLKVGKLGSWLCQLTFPKFPLLCQGITRQQSPITANLLGGPGQQWQGIPASHRWVPGERIRPRGWLHMSVNSRELWINQTKESHTFLGSYVVDVCVAKVPDSPTRIHGACQFFRIRVCLGIDVWQKSVFQFEKDGIRESLIGWWSHVNLYNLSHKACFWWRYWKLEIIVRFCSWLPQSQTQSCFYFSITKIHQIKLCDLERDC